MKKGLFVFVLFLFLVGCSEQIHKVLPVKNETKVIKSDVPSFYKESVIKNMDWKESPVFSYEGIELRGMEGKVAILSTPWKANTPNKYMWHFFGNDIPAGHFSVIATKKETNETSKALYNFETSEQSWDYDISIPLNSSNHVDVPAAMQLPSKGMWVLNAYIDKELFGQIIVNVGE